MTALRYYCTFIDIARPNNITLLNIIYSEYVQSIHNMLTSLQAHSTKV